VTRTTKTLADDRAADRRGSRILEALLRAGRVAVDALAADLEVSTATVRRDLAALERRGLLRRVHGGAVAVEPMLYEPFRHVSSFGEQEREYTDEKRRIALAAVALVADGETVAIGAGTTTTQVARGLRHRRGITVLTNAVNVAMELSNRGELAVRVTGGSLSGDWFALVGEAAVASVREMFVDWAFVGVDGAHAERGLTTNYPEQAPVHRQMLVQARRRVVVADRRKLGAVGTSLIAPADDLHLLITDRDASDDLVAPFAARKIRVQRA
jgi:DeoR family transcriptional regulator of aga operon